MGTKEYYLFLRSNLISIYTPEKGEFKSAPIEDLTKGDWYTIKVVFVNDMINVFLNNILKLQIPTISANIHISKVGIRSYNTITEFKPLNIGITSALNTEYIKFDSQQNYNNYYYSVSALALSKIRYDIFAENDFSAFSKRNVILTSDPVNADTYLEFAKKGGNIIVPEY